MTWTRVKRWIGTHPAATIAPVVAACSLATGYMLVMLTANHLTPLSPAEIIVERVLMLAGLIAPLPAIAWSCLVGCFLGRSGLPLPGAKNCVKVMWLACSAALSLYVLCVNLGTEFGWSTFLFGGLLSIAFGLLLATAGMVPIAIGLALASRITRRMIRRGKWEHTEPVERPKEHP